VVDDNPPNVLAMLAILEGLGLNLVTASSGREALRHLLEKDFAVILLDAQMPDMDGFETAAMIRQRERNLNTPIIFVTAAFPDAEHSVRAYAMGAVDYIFKPVSPEILRAKVSVFVELHRKTEQLHQLTKTQARLLEEAAERQAELEHVNGKLKQAHLELKALNEGLEDKVHQRTAALQVSEANYRTLLDTNIHAVVVVDSDNTVRYANKAAHELLGPENGKLAGTAFDLPSSPDKIVEYTLGRSSSGDRILEIRTESTTWQEAPAHRVSLIDITERRVAEELIRRAQEEELRLRNRFLSHASHELRTPVATAYQFVTILLDGLAGELSPAQREYLQIVFRNIEELVSMVDDLMDATRGDAEGWDIHPEPVDIVLAIKHAQQRTENLSQARHVKVTMAGPDSLPDVLADPTRVRQVVSNLIAHAVQHTPEGEAVQVWWGVHAENPAYVCVSVTDRAESLGKYDRLHVFDKMHQVGDAIDDGRKGLGTGLHIAKALVCGQHGRIWTESAAPRGNTFSFTLPLSSQSGSPAAYAKEKQGNEKIS
jgi:signal transduction histidine kinase